MHNKGWNKTSRNTAHDASEPLDPHPLTKTSDIWEAVLSWQVVGAVIVLLIGGGISVMTSPYVYLADGLFVFGFSLLAAKVFWCIRHAPVPVTLFTVLIVGFMASAVWGNHRIHRKPNITSAAAAPKSLQPPGIPGPGDDVYLPAMPPDPSWDHNQTEKKRPHGATFAVELGTALLRPDSRLIIGPYASSVIGCQDALVRVDYLTHMKILNGSSSGKTIKAYSFETRMADGSWEPLRNVRLLPHSKLYFVHTVGPQVSEMLDTPLIDNALREHLIQPGESISGFALLAFPIDHKRNAFSKFTEDQGDITIGQFPRSDVRISVVDGLGREERGITPEREYGPNSIESSTIHLKFGDVLVEPLRLAAYSTACKP